MNCFYHPYRHAVAQCVDCGKGLCVKCASKYEVPICTECNKRREKNDLLRFSRPLVVCAALFLLGCMLGTGMGSGAFIMGYLFICVYGGWRIVGMFFSNIFISLDAHSIIFYYGLRFFLSAVVGIFATPVYLVYCIYQLIKTKMK